MSESERFNADVPEYLPKHLKLKIFLYFYTYTLPHGLKIWLLANLCACSEIQVDVESSFDAIPLEVMKSGPRHCNPYEFAPS